MSEPLLPSCGTNGQLQLNEAQVSAPQAVNSSSLSMLSTAWFLLNLRRDLLLIDFIWFTIFDSEVHRKEGTPSSSDHFKDRLITRQNMPTLKHSCHFTCTASLISSFVNLGNFSSFHFSKLYIIILCRPLLIADVICASCLHKSSVCWSAP